MDYNINKCIPQWNPHSMMHLLKQNLVSELNADSIKKIGVSRGARTDRGVHALCNVVSLKLQIDQKYCSSMTNNKLVDKWNIDWDLLIQELNSQLPSDIKVNAIKHVTQSFNVKHQADQRMYNYISPSFSTVDYVQNICNQYLGTHNFHNYTSKKNTMILHQKDLYRISGFKISIFTTRTILSSPFLEIVSCTIKSENHRNYLLNRVGEKDLSFIQDTFSQQQHSLYIAPQQGLYLREIKFTGYNMKKDIPQKLETDFKQQKLIDAFEDQLIQYICEQYESYNIFEEWYKEIQKHKQ